MAKPELGTKRLCASCGAKFYDLNKDPIVCPKCETVFHPVVSTSTRTPRPDLARAAAAAPLAPEPAEAPEAADVELVSLEEADAESTGAKKAPVAGDVDTEEDVEVADDGGGEDDTFLETDEDEGDDVSDIVGGEREDEEDT
ncbi:MAG TPA: TIGR02300 family protein [Xanthobacteraceae bacterium]|nr:TIGR02300 family protein [Xanthobacteraceae bacterium]